MAGAMQQFDLSGRAALVTGAGSGLGRVFAETFAAAGASVVAADRDGERAEETAQLISAAGGRCIATVADVADPGSVEAMAALAERELGGCGILVNNAGISTPAHRVHELPVEAWNELIAINLTGTFLCSRAILPQMLTQGGGAIINIASILGLVGHYPGSAMVTASYAASKGGVIALTRQTAVEYAKDEIRANAIAPGWHGGTRLGEANRRGMTNAQVDLFEESILHGTPMGRRGRPEELGALALYLASDASSYVTGQVFTQDGGWTAA